MKQECEKWRGKTTAQESEKPDSRIEISADLFDLLGKVAFHALSVTDKLLLDTDVARAYAIYMTCKMGGEFYKSGKLDECEEWDGIEISAETFDALGEVIFRALNDTDKLTLDTDVAQAYAIYMVCKAGNKVGKPRKSDASEKFDESEKRRGAATSEERQA